MTTQYLTPPEIGKLLGCNSERIRGWIRSGELSAINLGNSKRRPRWRITQAAFDDFLNRRSNVATAKPSTGRRRMHLEAVKAFI